MVKKSEMNKRVETVLKASEKAFTKYSKMTPEKLDEFSSFLSSETKRLSRIKVIGNLVKGDRVKENMFALIRDEPSEEIKKLGYTFNSEPEITERKDKITGEFIVDTWWFCPEARSTLKVDKADIAFLGEQNKDRELTISKLESRIDHANEHVKSVRSLKVHIRDEKRTRKQEVLISQGAKIANLKELGKLLIGDRALRPMPISVEVQERLTPK